MTGARWSFDDAYIGRLATSGQALAERLIERPSGVKSGEWHEAAGKIVKILNALEAPDEPCPYPRQEVDEKVCPKCSLRWDISEEKPRCLRKK